MREAARQRGFLDFAGKVGELLVREASEGKMYVIGFLKRAELLMQEHGLKLPNSQPTNLISLMSVMACLLGMPSYIDPKILTGLTQSIKINQRVAMGRGQTLAPCIWILVGLLMLTQIWAQS